MTLSNILKDSNYKLTQFSEEQIEALEKNIFLKEVRGNEVPFTNCLVRRKDILNLPVPRIPKGVQENVTSKIQHSTKLRKKSKHLLEVAKKAVEIAIEENEKSAIKYIQVNT